MITKLTLEESQKNGWRDAVSTCTILGIEGKAVIPGTEAKGTLVEIELDRGRLGERGNGEG